MILSTKDQMVQNAAPIEALLKTDEVQQSLKIGATTVQKLVKLGLLTPIHFSKRLVRYRASEVEALIETAAKKGGVL